LKERDYVGGNGRWQSIMESDRGVFRGLVISIEVVTREGIDRVIFTGAMMNLEVELLEGKSPTGQKIIF